MDKQEAKKYFKEAKKIVITLEDWAKFMNSTIPCFNVYFLLDDYSFIKYIPNEDMPYYNKKKRTFKMNVLGVIWYLELVDSILRELSFTEAEIKEINKKVVLL